MPTDIVSTIATIKNEVVGSVSAEPRLKGPTGMTGYITIHDYISLNGCYVSPTKPIVEKNYIAS